MVDMDYIFITLNVKTGIFNYDFLPWVLTHMDVTRNATNKNGHLKTT